MYGGLTLHNLNLNGILSLNYQTIGGDQVADRLQVLTLLADKAYNPRTTIWDILTNVPNSLPPTPHYQDYDQFFGQEELVQMLGQVRDAILQNASLTQQELSNFLNYINTGNLTTYVKKTGDTMSGPLILSGSPIDNLQAATKQYVDSVAISNTQLTNLLSTYAQLIYVDQQDATKVSKTGDTMTGLLTLSGSPTQPLHATTKQYVDNLISNLQLQLTNVSATVDNLNIDPVTKNYVDDKINEVLSIIFGYIYPRP